MNSKNIIYEFIKMEYKAIYRNKFIKYNQLISLLFVPYVFFLFTKIANESISAFGACLLAAYPVIGLSVHIFAKDGYYYESIVTRTIPFTLYVKSKIVFIISYSIINYIFILLLLIFTDTLILTMFVSASVYYIGFGIFLMFFITSYDKHKIAPNVIPFFDYQGFSMIKLIFTFPIISLLFLWEETISWGIGAMFFVGILGFFLRNIFINIIASNLSRRKYQYLMGHKYK